MTQGPRLYDDRFGYPGTFALSGCRECRHRTLDVDFSQQELGRLYGEFYPRSDLRVEDCKPLRELDRPEAWMEGAMCSPAYWVPRGVRVLDIGCGFGETLGYHRDRGCDAWGVEVDENIRRVAERHGFQVRVGLFDARLFEEESFDYVTMAQVLEHTLDPVETLRGVCRVLKPGGVAVLTLPNAQGWGARAFGRRWIHWHAPYHVQFFSLQSMEVAAARAGMRVDSHQTITSSSWLLYQWIHLLTRPREGRPSGFWAPRRTQLTESQRLGVRLLGRLHRLKLDHLLTRLFDALGSGDNLVFVLRKPARTA